MKKVFGIILLALFVLPLCAQEHTNVLKIHAGYGRQIDTYLSPMAYRGWQLGLGNGWMVRLSSVRMYDRDKKDIENGIEPDIRITMSSSDQDDIIEQAILTIRLQKMEKN